jgi:hypothetical protein
MISKTGQRFLAAAVLALLQLGCCARQGTAHDALGARARYLGPARLLGHNETLYPHGVLAFRGLDARLVLNTSVLMSHPRTPQTQAEMFVRTSLPDAPPPNTSQSWSISVGGSALRRPFRLALSELMHLQRSGPSVPVLSECESIVPSPANASRSAANWPSPLLTCTRCRRGSQALATSPASTLG